MENPKFRIANLGPIKEGEIEQRPLTLFCGPNGSGKTWCMHLLHEFYVEMSEMLEYRTLMLKGKHPDAKKFKKEKLESVVKANASIGRLNQNLHGKIPECFSVPAEKFTDTKFDCINSKAEWKRQTESGKNPFAFLLPAERNGLPVAHYTDWLKQIPENEKSKSDIFHKHANHVNMNLIKGEYAVDQSGEVTFKHHKLKGSGAPQTIGLHLASGTVKSLFGLWFYLEHQAREGDALMMEKPELHLHPENQLKMARLLARLVNAGLKVVISTHSDYIVREINSLIMLSRDKSGGLLKKYGYTKKEVLDPDKVAAYLFDKGKIAPFKIDPRNGIYATTFDDVITKLNQTSDDIHYSLIKDE